MATTEIERQPAGNVRQMPPGRRFTTDNASEMARRSQAVQKQRKDAALQRQAEIEHTLEVLDHEQLGPFALTAALALAQSSLSGDLTPPDNPLDRLRLAETAVLLHKIGRLEMGESTSNAASLRVDVTDVEARRAELLARLHALDVESTTVDDVGMSPSHTTEDGNPPPS